MQEFAATVLAETLRRQPASKERTALAWSLAVGSAIARATTVELTDARLRVTARDRRWAEEIHRARTTILARLRHLLGPDAVRTISISRDV